MRYDQLIKSSEYNLQAKFSFYNGKCFSGELPDIPLSFKKMKNTGGICSCKWMPSTNTIVPGSLYISIDKTFLRDEQTLDAILIHEMIHAWFYLQGDFKENHGMKFEAMRRKLTAQVGFEIPRTEKMTDPVLADLTPRPLVVFVRFSNEGKEPAYFVSTPDYAKRKAAEYAAEWQARPPYYEARFAAFEITSPAWTQKAARMRLQRPVALRNAQFYVLKDESLLADLTEHGRALFDLANKGR